MKRFWIRFGIYLGLMVAIAWLNNVVMLQFHPLAYYYTPEGMLLNAAVTAVECLAIWPLSMWYLKRFLLNPEVIEEFVKETERSVQ